jgi:hypothetical protein
VERRGTVHTKPEKTSTTRRKKVYPSLSFAYHAMTAVSASHW